MLIDAPLRSALILGAALTALTPLACVKDDPIVTGNRDAAAPVVTRKAITPLADAPDDDLPDCSRCSGALDPNSRSGLLCRKNGARTSAVVLNELVGCACEDKCVAECANYCSGATQESACFPCILAGCSALLSECISDVPAK